MGYAEAWQADYWETIAKTFWVVSTRHSGIQKPVSSQSIHLNFQTDYRGEPAVRDLGPYLWSSAHRQEQMVPYLTVRRTAQREEQAAHLKGTLPSGQLGIHRGQHGTIKEARENLFLHPVPGPSVSNPSILSQHGSSMRPYSCPVSPCIVLFALSLWRLLLQITQSGIVCRLSVSQPLESWSWSTLTHTIAYLSTSSSCDSSPPPFGPYSSPCFVFFLLHFLSSHS